MNPSTPPKGSLEDLFRYHLLESEAAAVAPRPQVWEQVDTNLLLAQNEKYRRRLAAYRWAVAASLLLASLAGGGWWHSQRPAPATLAQASTQQTADQAGLAAARRAATAALPASPSAIVAAHQAAEGFTTSSSLSTVRPSAIDQTATLLAAARPGTTAAASRQHHGIYAEALAQQAPGRVAPKVPGHQVLASYASALGELASGTGRRARRSQSARYGLAPNAETSDPPAGLAMAIAPTSTLQSRADDQGAVAETAESLAPTIAFAAATSAGPTAEANLAARWASLTQPAADLPTSLATVALAPPPPLELARRWQYGASYSASAYNPNINWAKAPVVVASNAVTSYQPPTGFTRSVAAEYRDNLRTGLGQRLSLWATRRLGNGRWNLRTGLELAQNTASSASSVAFVGEPVADLSYLQAGLVPRLQRTSYRYRSVSVPAELRYVNPSKAGFSFYGRIGAMVTALLSVRSEVEGTPEATRTYSPLAGSTPYRHVSAGLRGGAGMQYRPAGHQWSLNFGPVAEMGILSLNADPSQDFWGQQRPYSFGLEAGMELGRGFRLQ
jgi:hypothetical protein